MTKDLDEVRIGVLTNLAKFVKVRVKMKILGYLLVFINLLAYFKIHQYALQIIGQKERIKVLDTLSSFLTTDNRNNWRFRLELSNQLGELTDMYEPEDVFNKLCHISLKLTQDPISEVRRASLLVVSSRVLSVLLVVYNPVFTNLIVCMCVF
jgi:hypothetical protein